MTIEDVAKLANVSIATVSRVINNSPSVRPTTRERVNHAIQVCNYIPNASARNMRADHTKTIGFVVSDISNPHFTVMSKAIQALATKHGYMVLLCETNEDAEVELAYLRQLQSMRVDGIILNTTALNDAYIATLSQQIPFVLVERAITSAPFHGDFVGSNNKSAIELITNYLISNGHRKIGVINSDFRYSTGRDRYLGFVKSMQRIGVDVDEHYLYRYDAPYFNVDSGLQGCRTLMELKDPPTALVAVNNALALGALRYLRMNNIVVPDDISILSYGAIENNELFYVRPGFATSDPARIGENAIKCLISRIENPQMDHREVVLEPILVINESVSSPANRL